MDHEYDLFDYQGELPKILTTGAVVSVRMVEDERTTDVPLFIRPHLVLQEKILQDFLSESRTNPFKPNAITKRELYVSGPPGCGKTAFMTLAAHRYAKHKVKTVLMVNFREIASCHIFKIQGEVTRVFKKPLNKKNIVHVVNQLMERQDEEHYDLAILDGVRQKLDVCSDLMSILNSHTGETRKVGRIIHTTSLKFDMPTGDKMQGIRSRIKRTDFDSFVEDDYQTAFATKDFVRRLNQELLMDILQWQQQRDRILQLESSETEEVEDVEMKGTIEDDTQTGSDEDDEHAGNVNMNEVLEDDVSTVVAVDTLTAMSLQDYATHKYYYAGGSARFMFEYTTDTLKSFLDRTTARLRAAEWEEFASGSVAPGATHSVNSLMQQFSGKSVAVSRYILFIAYDKVEETLVQAVHAVAEATGNAALKGWAFELRQLGVIKSAINQSDMDGGIKAVCSKEGLAFRPCRDGQADFDGSTLKPRGKEALDDNGTIIWCLKWNQGCFDVAYYKSRTLLTLQFTVSPDHSLKLHCIRALKEAIEFHSALVVETCVHVGVVDAAGTFTRFKFKLPEGGGRSSWNLDFTVNAGKATALFASKEEREDTFSATPLANYPVYTRRRREPVSEGNNGT